MLKSFTPSRSVITLAIDIRAILLIAISFILLSIFFIRTPTHHQPQILTPATSLSDDALDTVPDKHRLLRQRLMTDMPDCASGRAPTFLMVFMGHSGSTAIMTSLQQHSQTHISGFEPVDHGVFREGKTAHHSQLALDYTTQFFTNASRLGLTAGFKIRPPNIIARPTEFANLVRRFGTRIIWSYRTNVFKQAISDYNIRYYGDTAGHEGLRVENGTVVGNETRSSVRITNMDSVHEFLKSRIKGEKQVEDALRAIRPDGCVLPVSYESYLRHPEIVLQRVQTFLGLDTNEMHDSLRAKANSDTICDLVENWDEVCAAFFRCVQWRWMLDDFENGCSCTSLNPSKFSDSKKYCTLT